MRNRLLIYGVLTIALGVCLFLLGFELWLIGTASGVFYGGLIFGWCMGVKAPRKNRPIGRVHTGGSGMVVGLILSSVVFVITSLLFSGPGPEVAWYESLLPGAAMLAGTGIGYLKGRRKARS